MLCSEITLTECSEERQPGFSLNRKAFDKSGNFPCRGRSIRKIVLCVRGGSGRGGQLSFNIEAKFIVKRFALCDEDEITSGSFRIIRTDY